MSQYLKEDNTKGDVVNNIIENYTTFLERIKVAFSTTHDKEYVE